MVAATDITAVILAGGRGSRMGGVDKALQTLQGRALLQHVLDRLRQGAPLAAIGLNVNRNPAA